ncbi:SGNH/GDSL hydrolase family protein [Streptomyces sp. SBST2-5]|uniref:SGNH/GDSL hydrolase family protein n=1 Tax=Streptomyces composti TaxID=2720025 RepID=A0ABX1ABJ3_9ACTN|nr:SGNH/GDSL hydrolase family protein [Streptomyces composti]NJP51984.1 SGNH/GDSL hydrolase family protein [Streptomyces composti]
MTAVVARGARVLFIGDSITDAGRRRQQPGGMGNGYARMASAWFTAQYPDHGATFFNRGVSGDRVRDLRARWERDCLELSPQVVSVLIGVNDTWRRFTAGEETSPDDFERDYRHILTAAKERCGSELVLIEPFLIPVTTEQCLWLDDLVLKIDVVRKLAAEFDATLVAVDRMYATAGVPDRVWTDDGVHLTDAGHALLADRWLRAIRPAS